MLSAPTIQQFGNLFALHTQHTSYLFRATPTGHLEHLYYGSSACVSAHTEASLCPKHSVTPGCSIAYSAEEKALCFDELRSEFSTEGKGDFGQPALSLSFADGARTTDFQFVAADLNAATPPLAPLPTANAPDATLCITLAEASHAGLTLQLYYRVFVGSDVITRTAILQNATGTPITLHHLASCQLDFTESDFVFTTFHGSWANEMHRCDTRLNGGTALCEGRGGTSGNHANPFTILSRPGTSDSSGEAYGCNLIYSGNHRTIAQSGAFDRLRLQTGIHPDGFCYTVENGGQFAAPEAVLSYSASGYDTLSQNFHQFIKTHIVRGEWANKERPVLMNSWEACYMDFNERKLLNLAKAGKSCGVELFVLDDGWFGERNDDTKALGDWFVNTKKLPDGLDGLARKINEIGMHFGLWVEPEMVNTNSDLYRAHPDWALAHPATPHSEGRNQRILDLTNPEVRAYLKETISAVFASANIEYIKWDMNRMMSDVFSQYLPAEQQGEVAHRYILGLYEILEYLTAQFPSILFESCASGGNRADLGMLCYMPQMWASDNTDAASRAAIQTGYSYGYPLSTLCCHVSGCPNHQTLRSTPLDTRFHIAFCGMLGYEIDFTALSAKEKKEITAQIKTYQQHRNWLQYASYHRIQNGNAAPTYNGIAPAQKFGNTPLPKYQWCAVSADKTKAITVEFQLLHQMSAAPERIFARGLTPAQEYRVWNEAKEVDILPFGSLINQVSPVSVKTGGTLHKIAAQFIHLKGEVLDCITSGSALAQMGVFTAPIFVGVGFDEYIKYLPDFATRLYFIEAVHDDACDDICEDAGEDTATELPTESLF